VRPSTNGCSDVVRQLTGFPSHVDDRGTLVPIELDHVGFVVRRVFAVVGPPGGSVRGEHVSTCRELIILVSGEAEVSIGTGADKRTLALARPGSTAEVRSGDYVRYRLHDERAVIVVLADEAYRAPDPAS
jgi:hypothetical protein